MKIQTILSILFTIILFAFIIFVIGNPFQVPATMERNSVAQVGNCYFGPYPTDEEYVKFKEANIKKIVSLLDARVGFEKEAMDKEHQMAAKYGIEYVNYPMGSLMTSRLKADYPEIAKKVVDILIANPNEKIYIHDYNGRIAAQYVRNELLKRKGLAPVQMPELTSDEKKKYDAAVNKGK